MTAEARAVPFWAPAEIEAAIPGTIAHLEAHRVLAYPTETVYGLGADASNPDAVAAIFAAKGRPSDHPVIVHVALAADLTQWVSHLPAEAIQLATVFWPGPLTMILPRAASVAEIGRTHV